MEKKAAVIIPALNPDEKLVNTVKDVRKIWNGPVVIVDDGSDMQTRGFFQQAEQMNCTVLRHCVNLGKGRALKTDVIPIFFPNNPGISVKFLNY